MALVKCLQFTANIYDKNRCKNCYRPKDVHSDAALEKNKVSRKISRCGYLFVAPESFDFNSPLDSTRRWQRRFFILYDDGTLTYSVDENVNTVPQGEIDMNKCTEVCDAEKITSHPHSIAVATPDHVTYIKGASKEETNRWHDILVMYPRSAKPKHKRHPTFPQASSSPMLVAAMTSNNEAAGSSQTNASEKRQRYHSIASPIADSTNIESATERKESLSKITMSLRSQSVGESLGSKTDFGLRSGEVVSASSLASTTSTNWRSEPQPLTYRGVRSLKHRHDKSYAEGIRKSASLHDLAAPSGGEGSAIASPFSESRSRSNSRDSLNGLDQWDNMKQEADSKVKAVSSQVQRSSPRTVLRGNSPGPSYRSRSPTSSLLLNGHNKNETDEHKIAKSDFSPPQAIVDDETNVNTAPEEHVHDTDLEYMKKGWLVKQGTSIKDWTKYWFVLSGSMLKYYTDMEAEKAGREAGSINLALCYDMLEVVVARKYGFQLRTHSGDYTLSALTLGIRKNWMQAVGQCLSSNSKSSSSSNSEESSPQQNRRSAERYHTHSGSFIVRAKSREAISPKESHVETSTRKSSGIPMRKTEHPASEPPKYSVNRVNANEIAVSTANGTETVRMRSRRRTTENVTRLPDANDSDGSQGRLSCTWPYEAKTPTDLPRSNSNHSLKSSSQESGSHRDLSQYLDSEEKPRELSRQEEAELDNVQKNIRQIHRRSLTDSVQIHKLKHLGKFESGAAFNNAVEKNIERSHRSRSSEHSQGITNLEPAVQSPRSRAASGETASSEKNNETSPSAKLKIKTRTARSKSPPPEKNDNDDHYLDTFVRKNLDSSLDNESTSSSSTVERRWKSVEKSPNRPPPPVKRENVGDVLVDFWEAEVESIKGQLDRTQNQLADVQKQNTELRIQLRRSNIEQSDYVNDLEVYQSRFIPQVEDLTYLEQTAEAYKSRMQESENKAQRAIQQMHDLQNKLRTAEQQLKIQEDQMDNLQSKLSVSMSELKNLEDRLMESADELRSEQDSSQKTMDELEARIEELQRELEDKVNLVHKRDREIAEYCGKVQTLEIRLDEDNTLIEQLKVDTQSCMTLKRELEEKASFAAAMKQEAELLRKQLREQDSLNQKTQTDGINKMKIMEEEFYREKEQLQNRLDQVQKHVEQITKQSTMADSLNSNMADILKEKDETIAQLEEKVIECESRVDELTEELQVEVEDNGKLHASLDQANKEREKLKQQIKELQHEQTELEDEYSKLTNEIRELNKRLSEKDTEKGLLAKDLERVELKLKQTQISKAEFQGHSVDYEELQARYAELCEDLDRANNEIIELSEQLEREQQESASIRRVNEEAMTEVEQVRNLYEVALRDLNKSQNNTSDFEEQLKNKDRQNHSRLQAKEQEIHDLQFKLTQHKAEKDQIGLKVQALEDAKQELTEKLLKQKEEFQKEMECKYKELHESQKLLDELQEKLNNTESLIKEESQYMAHISKAAFLDSTQSSPRSETAFYSDLPTTYDELKLLHKKLTTEHREQKRLIKELNVRLEEADSTNVSLKQQLMNLETSHQGQIDQLSSKVQELTTQLSNADRRNKRLERRTRSQEVLPQVDIETQTDEVRYKVDESSGVVSEQVEEIQSQLEKSDAKINQLMDRLMQQRNFEVELDLLHQQLEMLEEENQKHRDRLVSLSSEDAACRDYSSSARLHELQLVIKHGKHLLEDCSKQLSQAQLKLHQKDEVSITAAKQCLVNMEVTLNDAKSVLPVKDDFSPGSLSDEVKMKLFSERLSLEAIILGEMSYLVRSDQTSTDQNLRDLYSAKTKASEITSQLVKQYCSADIDKRNEASLSNYASLLAEKLRIQTQLLLTMDDAKPSPSNVDIFVTDNKRLQHVARTSFNQSHISLINPNISSLFMDSCLSQACSRTDLARAMKNLQEMGRNSSETNQDVLYSQYLRLCEDISKLLTKLKANLDPVVAKQVKELTVVLLKCDHSAKDSANQSLELFSEELRHVTKNYLVSNSGMDDLYTEQFHNHLNQIVDEYIHRLLEDIESVGKGLTLDDSSVTPDKTGLEQDRTRLLLQLGYLISQLSIVQAFATYFAVEPSHFSSTSSPFGATSGVQSSLFDSPLPMLTTSPAISSPQDRAEVATLLARKAASRNDLASFILNNATHGDRNQSLEPSWQEQIVSLSSRLLDLDLELLNHQHKGMDYMSLIEREAISQAQLSYIIQYLQLKHQKELKKVHRELAKYKKDSEKYQKQALESDTDHEEELEDLTFELKSAHKQRSQVEEIAKDLESELQRKENNFRQEVQALKDGYEIRIRSIQTDLDAAKADLERLQQESEMENYRFEESLHASIIEYETKIEKIVCEKEHELEKCAGKNKELEEQINKLVAERQKILSASEEEGSSAYLSSKEAEAAQQRLEEIDTLRQQLEEEKRRHVKELERLQQVLQGDNNTAAQALLTSKIQQLEERIFNMQHDYEQELAIQKAAHLRELARSRDDMMQLLATAEEKSMSIDEEAMRKKYMKEIERIRVLYDRSFGAMEKSHQKVMMQMRKAHQRELDKLRVEKDAVLTEETKATQAALDAMRKAHERELQKERNKFLDVIAKTYSQGDVESLQKQHEADLDLIQGELKELSEQYSFRCLEKVSLEQRLWGQSAMVQKCRKHIQELMASREEVISRNKQDIEKLKRLNMTGVSDSAQEGQNLQVLMKVKDAEINQLGDEIKMLKDQLQGTVEELEEHMEKYHELHEVHNVTLQRHKRQVEELHRDLLQQSKLIAEASDDSLGLDSPGGSDANEDKLDLLTSTPHHLTSAIPEEGDFLLSDVKVNRSTAETLEERKAKKSLWRQKDPQRARSTPGLSEEMTLTLQKQMSIDQVPTPRKLSVTSNSRGMLHSQLSVDSKLASANQKL